LVELNELDLTVGTQCALRS